ncbi:hypothetical protein Y1Q_0018136 [Alligator mississippiensis]|uniref:Uncharacterized protein n=1 Tax=Alligator mississippiensis TaxID=8496 RepID=A0A151LZP0_ALLMI|nr:hypothetical protein Y1Q_0018136 [Alligator mississippiensis]
MLYERGTKIIQLQQTGSKFGSIQDMLPSSSTTFHSSQPARPPGFLCVSRSHFCSLFHNSSGTEKWSACLSIWIGMLAAISRIPDPPLGLEGFCIPASPCHAPALKPGPQEEECKWRQGVESAQKHGMSKKQARPPRAITWLSARSQPVLGRVESESLPLGNEQ